MAYCGECGTVLEIYPSFCRSCGAPNGVPGGTMATPAPGAPVVYTSPPPAQPPGLRTSTYYASWGARAGGYILDGLFTYVPLYIVLFIAAFGTSSGASGVTVHQPLLGISGVVVVLALLVLFPVIYAVGFTGGSRGQTPGMRIAGVRVIMDDGSAPIGYGRGLGRWVIGALFGLLLFIGPFLDLFWPLWDERNQTLHDKAMSTVVVRAR